VDLGPGYVPEKPVLCSILVTVKPCLVTTYVYLWPGFAGTVGPRENRSGLFCRITEKEEMAFRFGSDPATNTLVKTVLESL
jgi:hypothetical protein